MKKQFVQFLVRVVANACGLFVASAMLEKMSYGDGLVTLLVGATVLALVNAVIRPILVIFSLPFYIVTLGLFSLVVNAVVIYLADLLYKPLDVSGFLTAVLAGMIIGLVNYIVTRVFDLVIKEESNG